MTPQQSIEQAAKSLDVKWMTKRECFKAGADFVLQRPELFKEHIIGFHNWYKEKGWEHDYREQHGHTDDELFTLYLDYFKKQKQ